jgi:hypothetical protein
VSRFFRILLAFAAFSTFTVAQQRYTVSRPIITPPPIARELPEKVPCHTEPVFWETDYESALKKAESKARYLLIYLYADEDLPEPTGQDPLPIADACREFDTNILDDDFVRGGLDWFVMLKMPIDAKVTDEDGAEVPIFLLPGFEHMLGHPGLVVIDFANRDTPYYGQVTGILPFLQAVCPTEQQTATFLLLPPGTLTQRMLTYAVRIHPNQPLSSEGIADPIMVQLATEHALFQAERGVLGHHNYSKRSSQARDVLGDGMPSEICAQSRSGIGLFEGAIACMRLWRNSSAHWSIARKSHRYYGYDMALGKNGAWYAVGFFMD